MGALWVARIHISERVEEKINSKHGITADDVRDAVECVEGLECARSHHEVRGWRYLVKTRIRERPTLIVLYDEDFFEDDEPVADLLAEFDRAETRGRTQRPARGQTAWLNILGVTFGAAREATHRNATTLTLHAC